MAVPAPGHRAVCREAARLHVAAGRQLPGGPRLAGRLPAAVAAGGPADPVAEWRPGAPAMGAPCRAVRGVRPVRVPAVRAAGQARPDRHGAGGHDHAVAVGAAALPAGEAEPLAARPGHLRRGPGHGDQGRGLPAAAGLHPLAVGAAEIAAGAAPASRPARAGRPGGLHRGRGRVAGADAVGRADLGRSRPARLRPRDAVQADRHPLCQRLAPREAGLVLPADDADALVAGCAAGALAAARLVAAGEARGRTPCAAVGLGAAGAGVLQRQPRQARGLHLPDAAGAGGGRGAVVARAAAPTRSARDAVGLHGGAGGGGRRIGRVAAGGTA